jgi:hypothetical protein
MAESLPKCQLCQIMAIVQTKLRATTPKKGKRKKKRDSVLGKRKTKKKKKDRVLGKRKTKKRKKDRVLGKRKTKKKKEKKKDCFQDLDISAQRHPLFIDTSLSTSKRYRTSLAGRSASELPARPARARARVPPSRTTTQLSSQDVPTGKRCTFLSSQYTFSRSHTYP